MSVPFFSGSADKKQPPAGALEDFVNVSEPFAIEFAVNVPSDVAEIRLPFFCAHTRCTGSKDMQRWKRGRGLQNDGVDGEGNVCNNAGKGKHPAFKKC